MKEEIKRQEKLKMEYKRAIYNTLDRINENVNDIVDLAFNNSTKGIKITINIEPGEIVNWECNLDINTIVKDKTKEKFMAMLDENK